MVSQQIVPPEGRYKALLDMLRTDGGFGYAAIGYDSAENNLDINDKDNNYGFKELLITKVGGYQDRPRLQLYDGNDSIIINAIGQVVVNFEVELDTETITPKEGEQYVSINQIAIVDNAESNGDDTNTLMVATFTRFDKTSDVAISFILEAKM